MRQRQSAPGQARGRVHGFLQTRVGAERRVQFGQEAARCLPGQRDDRIGRDGGVGLTQYRIAHKGRHRQATQGSGLGNALLVAGVKAQVETGRGCKHASIVRNDSVQANTAGTDSDVDVLVTFDGPATSKRYFGVQFYLEDLLGHSVDLVTDKALRPELRPFVERDLAHV